MTDTTRHNLDGFIFKAMGTWGTAKNFKHFLPRILEILAWEPGSFGKTWPQLIFQQIRVAEFSNWPTWEQERINHYLDALWEFMIATYPSRSIKVSEFLRCLEDALAYLEKWDRRLDEGSALQHFAGLVLDDYAVLRRGAKIVKTRLEDPLTLWVSQPDKIQRLEQFFFANMDHPASNNLAEAADNLKAFCDWRKSSLPG